MTDTFSKKQRSEIMARVKSRDTAPERQVRSWLHKKGYRFRIHRKDLPGSPDIILPKYKTLIFVHGCFWHRHTGCKRATTPLTNKECWDNKFEKNIKRDRKIIETLERMGWTVIIIWECEIKANSFTNKLIHYCPK